MAAVSGQRLANLTKETLTKIPINDESFDHFYTNVARRSKGLLDEPTLPRKQHTPARLEVGASAPSYPQIPKFRRSIMRLFISSSGLSISALITKALAPTPRWRPSWLKLLMVTSQRVKSQSQSSKVPYSEDVDTGALPKQLSILEVKLKE